jgi:hypothetical protein
VNLGGIGVGVAFVDGLPTTTGTNCDLTLGTLIVKSLNFEVEKVELPSEFILAIETAKAE